MQENRFPFYFCFNLHKSLIPIGISDTDPVQLAAVYGVSQGKVEALLDQIEQENKSSGQKLRTQVDISPLIQRTSPLTVAFLGDSNTSFRGSYLHILAATLEKCPKIRLLDFSVSGQSSVQAADGLRKYVLKEKPDVAFVLLGSNDMYRSKDAYHRLAVSAGEFRRNMDYITQALTDIGTQVILTSLPPVDQDLIDQTSPFLAICFEDRDIGEYQQIIRDLAKYHGAWYNDMEPIYSQYSSRELLSDGMHLTALGQELLAKQALCILLDWVKESDSGG